MSSKFDFLCTSTIGFYSFVSTAPPESHENWYSEQSENLNSKLFCIPIISPLCDAFMQFVNISIAGNQGCQVLNLDLDKTGVI